MTLPSIPLRPHPTKETIQDRIKRKVRVNAVTGCWEYHVAPGKKYGLIRYNNALYSSHKLSYIVFKGPVPDGMMVLHQCDNPCCVNPDHLFLGDNSINMIDRESKGRGNTDITDQLAAQIRAERAATHAASWKLAAKYGLSTSTIDRILHGVTTTIKTQ